MWMYSQTQRTKKMPMYSQAHMLKKHECIHKNKLLKNMW